jgi:cell division septation protein DedD
MREVERARAPREPGTERAPREPSAERAPRESVAQRAPSVERMRASREPSVEGLRERGDDTAGRKLGLFALAGTLSVAAIISAGVLSGGTREPEPTAPDPLIHLAVSTSDAPKDLQAAQQAESAKVDPGTLDLGRLRFPSTLVGDEGPIATTMRGIRREGRTTRRAVTTDAPANTLASDQTERLERAALHDPQLANAMGVRTTAVAPPGGEGAFTLQVVAFETRDAAERFANALRARGHRAFVAQAELPGRGRSFRVRIGPFTTRREALNYQKSFEDSERMHGIVVQGSSH